MSIFVIHAVLKLKCTIGREEQQKLSHIADQLITTRTDLFWQQCLPTPKSALQSSILKNCWHKIILLKIAFLSPAARIKIIFYFNHITTQPNK
jgi:hypothetical protein